LVCHTGRGYRLRVFKNKVLRRRFRPNIDEVTGEWNTTTQ